jgi:hypothetical protein
MSAERFYACLLRAYSPAFRREYGEEMIETFRDLYRDSAGNAAAFWLFIVTDVVRSAARQRLAVLSSSIRRPEVAWVIRCASSGIAIVVTAHALSWSVGYLYHPYLEGISIPAWACGGALGLGLGVAQSGKVERRAVPRMALILATGAAAALGLQVAVLFGRPAVYGTALGAFVGGAQWVILGIRDHRAVPRVVSSMTAMSLAAAASAGAISVTLRGLNPVALDPQRFDLAEIVSRLLPPTIRMSTANLVVMIGCGLLTAVLTARWLSTMHAKGRPC